MGQQPQGGVKVGLTGRVQEFIGLQGLQAFGFVDREGVLLSRHGPAIGGLIAYRSAKGWSSGRIC